MPPTSGEMWGYHPIPRDIEIDCLMPTGIIIPLKCTKDATLESIKIKLWREAENYPLYNKLKSLDDYIFVSITQDATREDYYDEKRRLCDLRLFMSYLKVVEPEGNKEEKMLNSEITAAIGLPVHSFNEINDLEVKKFRRNILQTCLECVNEYGDSPRSKTEWAMFIHPPHIARSPEPPLFLKEILQKNDDKIHISVTAWRRSQEMYRFTLTHSPNDKPIDIIHNAIKKRAIAMPQADLPMLIEQFGDKYILKVWCKDEYLLKECPIIQYSYIQNCLTWNIIPQLMVQDKDILYKRLPDNVAPTYLKKAVKATDSILNTDRGHHHSSYNDESASNISLPLKLRIISAMNVDTNQLRTIFVRAGIYLGTEPLCQELETDPISATNCKWDQTLTFDIHISDIPRCARLCLSLCSTRIGGTKKSRKNNFSDKNALFFGNLNLYNFRGKLLLDKLSLTLWPMTKATHGLLCPVGAIGPNPDESASGLTIEFDKYDRPVIFPSDEAILVFAEQYFKQDRETRKQGPLTHGEREYLTEISNRDPLSELTDSEKEKLWDLRYVCGEIPDILPKLLLSVNWNKRENVAQVHLILRNWNILEMNSEVAMQLLDVNYMDLNVRKFAVDCLDKKLSDDLVLLYMIQFVQILKFEPYLDNALVQFLIRRSLRNQSIGNFLFWQLKAEMQEEQTKIRYGLILEAYCRSCGDFLKALNKEVNVHEKLKYIGEIVKTLKTMDKQSESLVSNLDENQNALKDFKSPLNYYHNLGELLFNDCKVMQSNKRPLMLKWKNKDWLPDANYTNNRMGPEHHMIIFKLGDDLRQDMLTLQVFRVMEKIWEDDGIDVRLMAYGCLSMEADVGMIEVVQESKTVMEIQMRTGFSAAAQQDSSHLFRWIKSFNKSESSLDEAVTIFTKSCAAYCVATYVLGISDRHQDNIMVNKHGQLFHIDFGHFLNHRKKKFGINREKSPFILVDDFSIVIAKGKTNFLNTVEFEQFVKLCCEAYMSLRRHVGFIITLFSLMMACGIPELQTLEDISYLRKTLAVCEDDETAVSNFKDKLMESVKASSGVKRDWFFHYFNKFIKK